MSIPIWPRHYFTKEDLKNAMIHSRDLTNNQLKILRCLSDGLLHVRKSISDETGINGKTTSNVLTRMELLDLVEHGDRDGRMGWKITDSGMRLIDDKIESQYHERDDNVESDQSNSVFVGCDDDHIEIVAPETIVADERPSEYFAEQKFDYVPKAEIDLDEIRKRCIELAVALRGEKGLDRIDVYSRAIERLANTCLLLK